MKCIIALLCAVTAWAGECSPLFPLCQWGAFKQAALIGRLEKIGLGGQRALVLTIQERLNGVPIEAKTVRILRHWAGRPEDVGKLFFMTAAQWQPEYVIPAQAPCDLAIVRLDYLPAEELQFIRESLQHKVKSSIRGMVEQNFRLPMAGMKVTLDSRSGLLTTITDEQGRYRFNNVLPGNYPIHFDAPGFEVPRVPREANAPEGGCSFREVNLSSRGRICVRVLDKTGGPLPGIKVEALTKAFDLDRIKFVGVSSGRTDAGGFAVMRELPSASYVISADGHYLGGSTRETATRIFLEPNGTRFDLEIRIPKR